MFIIKMVAKVFVVLYAIGFANTVPVVYENVLPGVIYRIGRAPNVAFGFGSGFSSNIGGISHSSGIGASFQSGDATAYGAGIGSTDGTSARGEGYAQAAPYYPNDNGFHNPVAVFDSGYERFGSAVSSAQNFGNYGSAVSSAHSQNGFGSAVSLVNGFGRGSAVSSVNSLGQRSAVSSVNGLGRYQGAVSSANMRGSGYDSAVSSASSSGLGYGSAVSSAQNVDGFGSTVALAQGRGFNNYGTSVAASHNYPGYSANVAHSVQQHGGSYQLSEASSINAPGVQSAQSHAINDDYNNY